MKNPQPVVYFNGFGPSAGLCRVAKENESHTPMTSLRRLPQVSNWRESCMISPGSHHAVTDHSTRHDLIATGSLWPLASTDDAPPRDSHNQRVIEARLEITPEPKSLKLVQDAFGNHVGIARFSGRSRELCFESTVRLEHSPLDTADLDLEDAARTFRSSIALTRCRTSPAASTAINPIRGTRLATGLVNSCPSVGRLAFRALTRLSQGINHGFRYRRREAKGIQPPVETLRLGHGSCRDFAVLLIDAARSLGFAARFASGYLAVPLDDPKEPARDSARGSTHAWAQIYLPGTGWIDFDFHERQYRQDWPCHRCGRTRSAPRDPAPWHLQSGSRPTISAWRCK